MLTLKIMTVVNYVLRFNFIFLDALIVFLLRGLLEQEQL